MTAIATIRVRSQAGRRPGRALVEAVAEQLRARGFGIRHVGRFGVSVSADADTFQRVLGVTVEPGQALSTAPDVSDNALADLIDLVEVTPRPAHF